MNGNERVFAKSHIPRRSEEYVAPIIDTKAAAAWADAQVAFLPDEVRATVPDPAESASVRAPLKAGRQGMGHGDPDQETKVEAGVLADGR